MSGARSYQTGIAAEQIVLRHNQARGAELCERRWRGQAGEIDLILRHADVLICVEVKAASTHDRAFESLSQRQLARIALAAQEYAGDTLIEIRVDLAAVDGSGAVEVFENVTV